MESIQRHVVYRTENKLNGKFYYGVTCKDNLEYEYYLGGGIALNKAIKKYGRNNFIRRIVMEFDTPEEAYSFEKLIVDQNFVDRKDCYNLCIGGKGGVKFTKAQRKKQSKRLMGSGHHRSQNVTVDGVEYGSINEAVRETGYSKSVVKRYYLNNEVRKPKGERKRKWLLDIQTGVFYTMEDIADLFNITKGAVKKGLYSKYKKYKRFV